MIQIITQDNKQLLLFFILCFLSFVFVQLADFVMAGHTASIDERIILLFRNPDNLSDPIGAKWLEEMMRDITALGGVGLLVFISFIVLIFLLIERYHRVALIFFIFVASGILLSFALKHGFSRPRPDIVAHGSYVYTSSFPSGHAMMSALIYLSIAGMLSHLSFRRRIRTYFFIVAIMLTIAIGISRVYLGVHYFTDVIGGWVLGSGWALLCYFVFRHLKTSHWIEENTSDVDPNEQTSVH